MRLILAAVAIIAMQCSAMAGYSLSWSPTTGTGNLFTPISVDLFLNETPGDTNLNNFGLANANISVTTDFGTLGVPTGNSGFDFVTPGNNMAMTEATISQGMIVTSPGVGAGTSSVRIGTFVINTTAPLGGSGSLTVSLLTGSDNDIATFIDAGFIDTASIGNAAIAGAPAFNFTFTAVPEPTSMAMAFGLGLCGTWYARRRAAKKQPAAA
jgi:hypothetical protein